MGDATSEFDCCLVEILADYPTKSAVVVNSQLIFLASERYL